MAYCFPSVAAGGSSPSISTIIARHKRRHLLRLYNYYNETYPKTTKAVIGGVLAGAGDITAQYMQSQERASRPVTVAEAYEQQRSDHVRSHSRPVLDPWNFDVRRCAAFTGFNGVWSGTVLHHYITIMEGTGWSVLRKIFVTHAMYNPFIYLPSFYVGYGLLAGQGWDTVCSRMKNELPETMRQCMGFWLPVNGIQFAFVPPQSQIAFLSGANLLWSVILSSRGPGSSSAAVEKSEDHIPLTQKDGNVPVTMEIMGQVAMNTALDHLPIDKARETDLFAMKILKDPGPITVAE